MHVNFLHENTRVMCMQEQIKSLLLDSNTKHLKSPILALNQVSQNRKVTTKTYSTQPPGFPLRLKQGKDSLTGPLTFLMMKRFWSSRNFTLTWVTCPLDPVLFLNI